jgi:hypothetical protein
MTFSAFTTVAGNGKAGYSGDGRPASEGQFSEMKRRGFTERELEMMFKDNPAKAIGLPVATSSAGR